MNSIVAIHPYKHEDLWVFDDESVGLRQEPFVSGADLIIDRCVEGLPDPENGFTLIFSANPFPEFQRKFQWRRNEFGGSWYYCSDFDLEGWLCPALFCYFEQPPAELFAQFRGKKSESDNSARAESERHF